MRKGLISGGNWIVDHVKLIDAWPDQDALANIRGQSWGNGGSAYNILKDIEFPWPVAQIIYQHHERLDRHAHAQRAPVQRAAHRE